MTKKFKKIILFVIGAIAVSGISYAVYYSIAKRQVFSYLAQHGYESTELEGFKVYLDGIVIDKADLSPSIHLQSVYLKANPFQMISDHFDYLAITDLTVNLEKLDNKPIGFPSDLPFEIENAHVTVPYLNIDKPMKVEIKNTAPQVIFVKFKTKNQAIDLMGQGDIILKNGQVKSVSLDLTRLNVNDENMNIRRGDGWLVLNYKKDWKISGEFGSGMIDYHGLLLTDGVLNLFGKPENLRGTISAKEKESQYSVSGEWHQKTIDLEILKEEKSFSLFGDEQPVNEFVMATIADHQKKKKIKPVVDKQVHIVEKKEIKQPVIVEDDSLIEEEAQYVRKNLPELLGSGFFSGFYYTKPLTVLSVACAENSTNQCWTAKALGGEFGFNEQNLPSYFLRLKDYEQSALLRQVLKKMTIKSITLQGVNQNVQKIILDGKLEDGRETYIELSVSDVGN